MTGMTPSNGGDGTGGAITAAQVRHVARLARLRLTDAEVELERVRLSAVLGYVQRLGELDLAGVEPLTHPGEVTNRLDEDEPMEPGAAGEGGVRGRSRGALGGVERSLGPAELRELAPSMDGPFVAVPKVIGEGGGA